MRRLSSAGSLQTLSCTTTREREREGKNTCSRKRERTETAVKGRGERKETNDYFKSHRSSLRDLLQSPVGGGGGVEMSAAAL